MAIDNDELLDDQLDSSAAEDSEELEQESGDPLEGREDLQKALFDLYLECCAEDRFARLIEVKEVKQAENYWAGRQYDWWSESEQSWKLPTQAPAFGDMLADADTPRFQFVTNIYQATGLTVIGAVAGAPPRVRFFPDDADNEADLETAAGRTKLSKLIERWNPPQLRLQQETYHAWTGGFIAWWSRYIANGDKYGVDSVNLLEQGAQETESTIHCTQCGWEAPADEAQPPVPCPQCGKMLTQDDISEEESISVPEDGGTEEIPKGRQVITAYGALNCKRPQHTNEQSQWHYFAIEEEIHYSILRAAHPTKASKIKPGASFGAEDTFERNARLALAENAKGMNATKDKLVTHAHIWFRPTVFWMAKEDSTRDELLELFPRGVHCEFAGMTYCSATPESMDDAIVSAHAMPGRGQHRNGIGTSILSVQDRFNVFTNIATETYEYGIPITYRASDTFSGEADDDQRAAPGLEVEVALPPGADLRQRIMQVRADSVSPDMAKHTMDLMGPVTQYLSGAFPALTGATGEGQQPNTLGQQNMQRDQAMGRMGVFYVNLKQAHADLMTISCRSLEAHSDGEVKIPVFGASGDFESESVDVTALEGEATAYPEGDENFPELWNQQRATMMQIMDSPFGPKLAEEPSNLELLVKLIGIPDMKAPGVDAIRKQLKEIAELTAIPKDDGLLAGIAPMVEVDSDDFHDIEAKTCQHWMTSEPGQKLKRSNPMGWAAVKQHRAQHLQAIPPPAPPEKPLSETLSAAFKDMPPEAQAQVLEKWGIHVTPHDFLDGLMLKKAGEKPKPPMPGEPHPVGTHQPPAAGAQ